MIKDIEIFVYLYSVQNLGFYLSRPSDTSHVGFGMLDNERGSEFQTLLGLHKKDKNAPPLVF